MLKHTDNLRAVAEAFIKGEVTPEEVHVQLVPRLEFVPELKTRKLLNDLELAVYTLSDPQRRIRILQLLGEAADLAGMHLPLEDT